MGVQRLVEVQPNATAANDILGQFNFLCPSESFSVDQNNRISSSDCTTGGTSESCDCLCDVTTDPNRRYIIEVHNVTNNPRSETLFDASVETIPMPSQGPTTFRGQHPTINMPSSTNSALAFGAFQADGTPLVAPNWRILGHELCGHARLNQSSPGRKGNRPGHDSTIGTENTIGAEHGGPPRGLFGSTLQGESFHSLPVSNAKLVFKLVDGWHHQQVP